jgi:hypothetical protein
MQSIMAPVRRLTEISAVYNVRRMVMGMGPAYDTGSFERR